MKILFIGGTGNISSTITRMLAEAGHEVHLLNRAKTLKYPLPRGEGDRARRARRRAARGAARRALRRRGRLDCVHGAALERNLAWFGGGAEAASSRAVCVHQLGLRVPEAASHPAITESTPLVIPYWEYSRNKIACEELLMRAYRENGFPITIVRPSHTYDTFCRSRSANRLHDPRPHQSRQARRSFTATARRSGR